MFLFYNFPKTQTINGATTKAGKKFPTRIFLISNKLLIAKPNNMTLWLKHGNSLTYSLTT